jgi:hypothetical protein
MKTKAFLAFALACTFHAQSAVLYDSFGPSHSFATNNPDPLGFQQTLGIDSRLAVPFTPSRPVLLDRITVAMSHVMGSNVVRLTVHNDAAGVPGDTVLDTMKLGRFPTIPFCAIVRTCALDSAGPGTVRMAVSRRGVRLEAGVTYWVVAEAIAPADVIAWHGASTATFGRAYDLGQGWASDLESAYALRVEGTVVPSVDELIALVNDSDLPRRQKRPLLAILEEADQMFESGHCKRGMQLLQALQLRVRALLRPQDAQLAKALTTGAQTIIQAGCRD